MTRAPTTFVSIHSIYCYLQETGALATSASVVQADPSVREGEDWKHKVYQKGVEHTKVSHV